MRLWLYGGLQGWRYRSDMCTWPSSNEQCFRKNAILSLPKRKGQGWANIWVLTQIGVAPHTVARRYPYKNLLNLEMLPVMGILMCDQGAHDGNRFVLGLGDNLVAVQHLAMASSDLSLWLEGCNLWPKLYRRRHSWLDTRVRQNPPSPSRFMCTVCTDFIV